MRAIGGSGWVEIIPGDYYVGMGRSPGGSAVGARSLRTAAPDHVSSV